MTPMRDFTLLLYGETLSSASIFFATGLGVSLNVIAAISATPDAGGNAIK